MTWPIIHEQTVDLQHGQIHLHGWQSWSPTTTHSLLEHPFEPGSRQNRLMNYRPDRESLPTVCQAEGLLVLDPGNGEPTVVVTASNPTENVPSIRLRRGGNRVALTADGEVEVSFDGTGGGIDAVLARWADRFVARWELPAVRPAPTLWSSWYHYFEQVTEADIVENLAGIEDLDLPVDVVQLDDGYQAHIGDWLELSDRFDDLGGVVDRITSTGRRAGIWVAPFLVGERSRLWNDHPEWLVTGPDGPVDPGRNWGQRLGVLDVTHPGAEAELRRVFTTLHATGFDLFKIDFLYPGAIPGRRHGDTSALQAYRHGLTIIRQSIGDAYLLGCGAPILPSAGLVDAMRISPDTAPHADPVGGDMSQPSSRAARLTGRARAFLHGRFWANDPDCLLARPAVEHRAAWAEHVEQFGGLHASSDRIADLDDWGLTTTQRILSTPPPRTLIPT